MDSRFTLDRFCLEKSLAGAPLRLPLTKPWRKFFGFGSIVGSLHPVVFLPMG